MASDADRVAQVFIWKEGSAPDLEYARHVLGIVNPDTARSISGENPPLQLFTVEGTWPDEPWERAIADMRALTDPDGSSWTDTSRFDLAGWQGRDSALGDRLFTVTAYRRALPASSFTAANVGAPSQQTPPAVPQVPYYPQFPSGSVPWPPTNTSPDLEASGRAGHILGSTYGTSYEYPTDSLITNPLGLSGAEASGRSYPLDAFPASYAPYYTGFGPRLGAALIDLFFMMLFQGGTLIALIWRSTTTLVATDDNSIRDYGLLAFLGLITFALYHIVQLSIWGQTIGKKLMSVKVVRANGALPGVGQALLRMVGYIFSLAVAGWGFFMIALDPKRQGLHDKIAGTYVVPERPPAFVPAGLPGYAPTIQQTMIISTTVTSPRTTVPAVGMAVVGSTRAHSIAHVTDPAGYASPSHLPVDEVEGARMGRTDISGQQAGGEDTDFDREQNTDVRLDLYGTALLTSNRYIPDQAKIPYLSTGPVTDMNIEGKHIQSDALSKSEKARALFRQGLAEMESGSLRPSSGSQVDPSSARAAAYAFQDALFLVPTSVAYRYFSAVALRYSASFDVALRDFKQVLEHDPNHYEARQQITYRQRWHDAFAYPAWVSPAPVPVGVRLPQPVLALLPSGNQPVTRLVLLREGGNKIVAMLNRVSRADWVANGTTEVAAQLRLTLSRTPHGPIVALYVILQDRPQNPYVGETFLNPHDPDHPTGDACRLGQHMLEQLARQDRTFLIFVDEENKLLLSRKLVFDAQTQVSMSRVLYEAQTLPPQTLDAERFKLAAQWHMQHFNLDQVKESQ